MSASDETPAAEITSCRTCKEPIRVGAIKCIHCDSFQDWRGSLSLSSTILSLLVALVSVLAFAGPILKELFIPKNSHVILSFSETVGDTMHVVASNTGNRPGAFGSGQLEIHYGDGRVVVVPLGEPSKATQGPTIFGPGESKAIRLVAEQKLSSLSLAPPDANDHCVIRLWAVEFNGAWPRFEYARRCHQFIPVVK